MPTSSSRQADHSIAKTAPAGYFHGSILARTLNRKRKAVESHLAKAVKQMRGVFTQLTSVKELRLRTPNIETTIELNDRFVIGVIVLREMFDDQFKEYSKPVLELIQEAQKPCLALDYTALHILTCSLSNWEAFVAALEEMFVFGLSHGEFPRPRFLGPSEGKPGDLAVETPEPA